MEKKQDADQGTSDRSTRNEGAVAPLGSPDIIRGEFQRTFDPTNIEVQQTILHPDDDVDRGAAVFSDIIVALLEQAQSGDAVPILIG